MDSNLKIRLEKDVEKVAEILFDADIYPRLFPYEIANLDYLKDNIHKLKDKTLSIYVFSDDDKDFGVGILKYFDKLKVSVAEIGVLKEFRGKKAKQCAEEALKDYVEKHPNETILAKIKTNNKPSLYFSQMVGFKITNKHTNYYFLKLRNAA